MQEDTNHNEIEQDLDVDSTEEMEVQAPELKPQPTIEIEEDTVTGASETEDAGDGITVGDPMLLRPVELPLVVKLPAGASKAQIAYAKTLNGYAYQNPTKFAQKKDALIAKLKSLKNAPDPIEGSLKINNSFV